MTDFTTITTMAKNFDFEKIFSSTFDKHYLAIVKNFNLCLATVFWFNFS
jgi:hypothetical protein